MTIDFSKLKKAPTPQHLEHKYELSPPLTPDQLAAGSKFADLVRRETDAAIAQLQACVARPVTFVAPTFAVAIGRTDDGALGEAGRARLKHGPGGRGGSGPCDPDCRKCALENAARDPLDVKHDGVTLRVLLVCDESNRREFGVATPSGLIPVRVSLTPAQRAAISAHWSAELRAKVAASAERDRNRVLVDLQDEP